MKSRIFKSSIPFVVLFIVFASFYYDSVLHRGPLNAHLWRQSDCLSLTENYADGASFWAPEMHAQLGDEKTTGLSAGEFPVLYYTVGTLWKWFGKSHFIYRFFYLIITFAGVFAFYKSLRLVFQNNFWATVIALLLFTSPAYAYYGISFMTDGPAFSFILIALYFLLQYHRKQALRLFYMSMAFFALAGLIKVSSLIAFVFLGGILFLETLGLKTLRKRKVFHGWKHEWIGFALAVLVIFSWYYYASVFNEKHHFKYTFNDIWPVWNMEWPEVIALTKGLKDFTSYIFFSRPMIYLIGLSAFTLLLLWKKVPLFLYLSTVGIVIGSLTYFILWAPLMGNHDYYFVALLILFVALVPALVWYIKTEHIAILKSRVVQIVAIGFLLFNFLYCWQVMQLKTVAKDRNKIYAMVGGNDLVIHMTWSNGADCEDNWYRFERMRSTLRNLGVKKEDKVISLPDNSFNVSLYLMGQKGWTNFQHYASSEDIEHLIDRGAKYLILSDPNLQQQEYLQPFLGKKIGEHEGIGIYALN